jgi:hypothetical protein
MNHSEDRKQNTTIQKHIKDMEQSTNQTNAFSLPKQHHRIDSHTQFLPINSFTYTDYGPSPIPISPSASHRNPNSQRNWSRCPFQNDVWHSICRVECSSEDLQGRFRFGQVAAA